MFVALCEATLLLVHCCMITSHGVTRRAEAVAHADVDSLRVVCRGELQYHSVC